MEESLLDIYNEISIQQYKTDMGFKALVEGVHENLFVIPEYQRKYRWSKEQADELAASLIRDLPIPPVYTFRNETGQLEILDGQQRIMSLYFYYIGKFFKNANEAVDYSDLDLVHGQSLEEALEQKYQNIVPAKFFMRIEGKEYDISYETLPLAVKRKIDYRPISIIEIKTADPQKRDLTLYKIFANLNHGGSFLSEQELRNGIYPCVFSRAVNLLNKTNQRWRELYGRIDNKCKDIELLYRLCTMKMYVEYDGEVFKIQDYQNSIQNLIDRFTEEAFCFTEKTVQDYITQLEQFISLLDISKKHFKKIFLLEGIFVVWSKCKLEPIVFTDQMCDMILNDPIIKTTQQGGTISITNMNKRWKRIYEILSGNGKQGMPYFDRKRT